MSKSNLKTLSLVLGSGGARGLAHIGVIRWLEQNGFKIESISGCSIGALIGGVYAAGKLDDFEIWVRKVTKVDMVKLLDLSWRKSGLVKGDKLIHTLTELVGDRLIEDLPITYTAIAADIANEKEVWMNSGKLFDAIRASISLPLLFTPFRYNDADLIDGGVLNPVPIAPTFNDSTDFTLAVDLLGKVSNKGKTSRGKETEEDNKSLLAEQFSEFVDSIKEPKEVKLIRELSPYDIANQAFDAMQGTIARQKLAAYPPEYSIQIPRNACGILEFDRAAEMIDLGYAKAEENLRVILC